MSDARNDNEPDAAGTGTWRRLAQSVGSPFSINLSGLDKAKGQIEGLNTAIGGLDKALSQLNTKQWALAEGITRMLDKIGKQAQTTTSAVRSVTMAIGGVGAGGTAGGGSTATPSGAIAAAAAQGGGGAGGGGLFSTASSRMANLFDPAVKGATMGQVVGGVLQDLAMAPLRFMTQRIDQNRALATGASVQLGGQAFAYQQRTANLMTGISRMPGNVFGNPQELLDLFNIARQAGAMTNLGMFGTSPGMAGTAVSGGNAPRVAGFLQGINQMQMMTPGAPVAQMAGTLGGFGANVGAQQLAAFQTGGAFSIIAPGGGQKSLQQWAEGILRWLEGLRPGKDRGKGFSRGELMSQYFPGSNIDAWFTANGVDQNMREYWWTYALGKASATGGTGADREFKIKAEKDDVAFQRLRSQSALTRSEFGLAGTMAGQYANREQSNRWFNEIMGQVMQQVVPSVTTRGPLSITQFLPDEIQQMLMAMLEATGPLGAGVGGLIGWGGAGGIGNIFKGMIKGLPGTGVEDFLQQMVANPGGDILGFLRGAGDVGDVGDWSSLGGTTTAGLHPDMRRKMNRMMQANPRLQVTSGLRDRATQQKLRGKGFSRVSGQPSAHTRGMAADMGPASEYPWLVANASKFGLKSGVGAGEPWHVGIGDLPPADTGIFRTLLDMFWHQKGVTPEQGTSLVGGSVTSFINLLLGTLGAGAQEPLTGRQQEMLQFDPGVYGRLVEESMKGYTFGGLVPDLGWSGGGNGPDLGPGRGRTRHGDFASPDVFTRMVATAEVASKYFSGAELAKAIAIAKYESGYNPGQTNMVGGDNSYGLWQINMKGNMGPDRSGRLGFDTVPPYNELLDPAMNARAARMVYDDAGGSWDPWTTRNDPTSEDLRQARLAMEQANVGDVEMYSGARSSGGGTRMMTFNNTFVIQGGGSNGGIDVRRSASAIADQLEAEMNRRMARRN